MPRSDYATDVFINCPFDRRYIPIFRAIVFSVFDCGFRARCAQEIDDASQVRIDKIFKIIAECKYGLHDISRTTIDSTTRLPRFNMPLELGMFLAAKRFGAGRQKQKVCLVLDTDKYRYQRFISDISGYDICAHDNSPKGAITLVRNWLSNASRHRTIPGGREICKRYDLFSKDLPKLSRELKIRLSEFTFNDYASLVEIWLAQNG